MATIDDLNISISSMKYEEAFALVRELRKSRRTSKKVVKVRTTNSTPRKTRAKATPTDIIATLTPAQKKALLQMFEKEMKSD